MIGSELLRWKEHTSIIKGNMKRKFGTSHLYRAIIILLLVLWIPVTIDKITDFPSFRNGILNQPFSDRLGYVLIYSLPILEAATIAALVITRFQKVGLIMSTVLLTVFTGYITVALLGAWEKLPCGCGSVISGMNWTQHLFFNLFFLTLSGWGIYLWYKLRSNNAGSRITEGLSAKRLIKNISN